MVLTLRVQAVAIIALLAIILVTAGCRGNGTGADYKAKNPELKDELSKLRQDMGTRNFTRNDTVRILELSQDPVERFYAREFEWLVLHGEQEHLSHPLTFLDWYARTGKDSFCAPHELGHFGLLIEEDDVAYAEENFAVIREKLPMWREQQELNRQRHPTFYEGLDELDALIAGAVGRLEQKNYNPDTLALLAQIDEKSIC